MVSELTALIRGKNGNGAVTTTRALKGGGAADTAVKKRLNANVTYLKRGSQCEPQLESSAAHSGGKADSGGEFMSLDDDKRMSGF